MQIFEKEKTNKTKPKTNVRVTKPKTTEVKSAFTCLCENDNPLFKKSYKSNKMPAAASKSSFFFAAPTNVLHACPSCAGCCCAFYTGLTCKIIPLTPSRTDIP